MNKIRMVMAAIVLMVGFTALEGRAEAYSKKDCEKIVQEIRRQGGGVGVQQYLGRRIAWRESGCSLQCVSDRDDHSCSRFGLNFKGAMGKYWGRLCGATSRNATRVLRVDVRCALAAYRTSGTRPWATR